MSAGIHILRVTIQAKSPVSLGSGKIVENDRRRQEKPAMNLSGEAANAANEPAQASAIARDANGLPTFPGSSIQGVLLSLWLKKNGLESAKEMFGFEDKDGMGQAGKIVCSWAVVHDSNDVAVTEPIGDAAIKNDKVLSRLASSNPRWRDHAAMNSRHSVDNRRKFARTAAPRGTRFSLELTAWGDDEMEKALIEVARLFRHPRFRLGGASRRGYGRVDVIQASYACPDLNKPKELRELRRAPPSTGLQVNLLNAPEFAAPEMDATTATISLRFLDAVRIGSTVLPDNDTSTEGVDSSDQDDQSNILLALQESDFNPETNKSEVHFPLPGSSFKGPLVHRMVYYANQAAGRKIDIDEYFKLNPDQQKEKLAQFAEMGNRPVELNPFLGTAKGPDDGSGRPTPGSASRITVDDALFSGFVKIVVDHNSTDRFSGGVREQTGVLFAEEWLLDVTAEVVLTIREPRRTLDKDGPGGWENSTAEIFLKALRDICTARVPIGARSLGVCDGQISWNGPHQNEWASAAATVWNNLALGD